MIPHHLTRNASHDTCDLTRFALDGVAQNHGNDLVRQCDLSRC